MKFRFLLCFFICAFTTFAQTRDVNVLISLAYGGAETTYQIKDVQRANVDSVMYARVERGLWKQGANGAVDKYGFKLKDAEYTPSEEFPIVLLVGKVIKAPQEYTDERAKVTTDYQDYLEKEWVAKLREKYPVVINQAVWESIQ